MGETGADIHKSGEPEKPKTVDSVVSNEVISPHSVLIKDQPNDTQGSEDSHPAEISAEITEITSPLAQIRADYLEGKLTKAEYTEKVLAEEKPVTDEVINNFAQQALARQNSGEITPQQCFEEISKIERSPVSFLPPEKVHVYPLPPRPEQFDYREALEYVNYCLDHDPDTFASFADTVKKFDKLGISLARIIAEKGKAQFSINQRPDETYDFDQYRGLEGDNDDVTARIDANTRTSSVSLEVRPIIELRSKNGFTVSLPADSTLSDLNVDTSNPLKYGVVMIEDERAGGEKPEFCFPMKYSDDAEVQRKFASTVIETLQVFSSVANRIR